MSAVHDMLDARRLSKRRRMTRGEMRALLAIEQDLDDRRGLHIGTLPADLRREIRETWKRIVSLTTEKAP